jgi:AraC-like DNA-binding protein
MYGYDFLWYYQDMKTDFLLDMEINGITVRDNGDVRCPANWTWTIGTENPFTDFDLWTVKDGKGLLKTNGKTFRLEKGDSFLFSPGDTVRASTIEAPSPLQVCFVHFGTPSAPSLRPFLPLHRKLDDETVVKMQEKVVEASIAGRKTESEAYLKAVLYLLLAANHPEQDQRHARTPLAREVEQICGDLRQEPERPHRLRTYARRCNVSYEHLGKVFKRVTGMSFTDYLNEARLAKADFLLSSSNYTVSEIAEILGFCDNSYFSKYYRRHRGTSPSKTRNLPQEVTTRRPSRPRCATTGSSSCADGYSPR